MYNKLDQVSSLHYYNTYTYMYAYIHTCTCISVTATMNGLQYLAVSLLQDAMVTEHSIRLPPSSPLPLSLLHSLHGPNMDLEARKPSLLGSGVKFLQKRRGRGRIFQAQTYKLIYSMYNVNENTLYIVRVYTHCTCLHEHVHVYMYMYVQSTFATLATALYIHHVHVPYGSV